MFESAAAVSHLNAERVWTDKAGRQATAALFSVEGETVRFKKPNGKFATTPLRNLSLADQQFVERYQSLNALRYQIAIALAKRPFWKPVIDLWLETIGSSMAKQAGSTFLLKNMAPSSEPDPKPNLPSDLVYVDISHRFLQKHVRKVIERNSAVSDIILGTDISGWAHTKGQTDIALQPAQNQAVATIFFSGIIQSQTEGYNGPVILYSNARTEFSAAKQVILTSSGLQMLPAVSRAQTTSVTRDIESSLPGLRGRIAEQIAWGRVAEMRPQADLIAARHAEARINRDLDRSANRLLTTALQRAAKHAKSLQLDQGRWRKFTSFQSTPDNLRIIVSRNKSTSGNQHPVPPPIDSNPEISVRVHRVLLERAIVDPKLKPSFLTFLDSLTGHTNVQELAMLIEKIEPLCKLDWSPDGKWLIFQYDSSRSQTQASVGR